MNPVIPGDHPDPTLLFLIDWFRFLSQFDTLTSVDNNSCEQEAIKTFQLNQAYPNPFNSYTSIHFSISYNSDVSLKIYNLLGKEVATLIKGKRQAGNHVISFNRTGLSSGVYLYRMMADHFMETKKFLLLK